MPQAMLQASLEYPSGMKPGPQHRRLARMHSQQPHCYYCGILTNLVYRPNGGPQNDDDATIEHLYSRLNPKRFTDEGKRAVVIACFRCNNGRGCREGIELVEAINSKLAQPITFLWAGSGMADFDRLDWREFLDRSFSETSPNRQ